MPLKAKAKPIPEWVIERALPDTRLEVRGPWICWRTKHRLDCEGYTKLFFRRDGVGRNAYGHRLFYAKLIGPPPLDKDLDHLCRNRACVNPWHLDPVAEAVNLSRGEGVCAKNARKSACKYGHEFTEANTVIKTRRGRIGRACLECRRRDGRERMRAKRALIRAARATP